MSATKDFLFTVLGDDWSDAGEIKPLTDHRAPVTKPCPDCGESCQVFQVRGRDLLYCPECVKAWRVEGADRIPFCSGCGNDAPRDGECPTCRVMAAADSAEDAL